MKHGLKNGCGNGSANGIGHGMTATLDKAGRIVLPKKLRDRLHLKPGAKFKFEVVGEKIEIEQEVPTVKVVRNQHGRRVVVGWEGFDAAKAVREMHDELAQRGWSSSGQ